MLTSSIKSVTLDTSRRERFTGDLLRHRFSKDVTALAAEYAVLADLVYLDVYKPAVRAKMAELPAGWLPEARAIEVQFAENAYVMLRFNGFIDGFPFHEWPDPLAVPGRRIAQSKSRCAKAYEAGHKLAMQFAEISARRTQLLHEAKEAKRQITAVLSGVRTTKQLRDAWPEAAPFVSPLDAPPKRVHLPAQPLSQLNAVLGLTAEGR